MTTFIGTNDDDLIMAGEVSPGVSSGGAGTFLTLTNIGIANLTASDFLFG
jgi:hypothetical protein